LPGSAPALTEIAANADNLWQAAWRHEYHDSRSRSADAEARGVVNACITHWF